MATKLDDKKKLNSLQNLVEDESFRPDFKFSPEEFKRHMADWVAKNLPVQYLLRDHYGAKLLIDNQVFNLIKHYKHEWKFDEEDGILILHKKTKHAHTAWHKWNELYPYIIVKKSTNGDLLFENASYGDDGFEFERHFQYSPSDFKDQFNKWVKEGWPVQFLLRDHFGAKVAYDNQLFQLMEFYGHEHKWDEEVGLILMCKKSADSPVEWVAWQDIIDEIPVVRTAQGWLLFDGWIYSQEGLIPRHLWQWHYLEPCYKFPDEAPKPDYCYLDIVTFNWEHAGMPGFGFFGNPHGHTSLEFGDDLGNFWSVGMYMDPRSLIDTKKTPIATVRACLMSPDPYLASYGEKTVHRYNIGQGKQGRENLRKLVKYFEDIQSYSKNPVTGITRTCPRKYHTFKYNCGDLVEEVENFAIKQLGGALVKLDDKTIYVPTRQLVGNLQRSWWSDIATTFWNRTLLFFVDSLIWMVMLNPWIAKKLGAGLEDDFSDFETDHVTTHGQVKKNTSLFGFTFFTLSNLKPMMLSLRPKTVKFPRRRRVDQLYSPRLKRYSAVLKS